MTHLSAAVLNQTAEQMEEAPEQFTYATRTTDPVNCPASSRLQALEAARYRYAVDHGLITVSGVRSSASNRTLTDDEIDKRIAALPGAPVIPEPIRSPSTMKKSKRADPVTGAPGSSTIAQEQPQSATTVTTTPNNTAPRAPAAGAEPGAGEPFRLNMIGKLAAVGCVIAYAAWVGNHNYVAEKYAAEAKHYQEMRCGVFNA
jgi:hypothetical protein